MRVWVGILGFILNFLDASYTNTLVKLAGYNVEMNPLMRHVMERTGDWWLAPKIMIGFIFFGICVLYWEKIKWFKYVAMGVVSAYFGMVGVHLINLYLIGGM